MFNTIDIATAILGGILISLATTIHLALKGRVTGFSGILFGLLSLEGKNFHWKLSVFNGLIAICSVIFSIYKFNPVSPDIDFRLIEAPENLITGMSLIGFSVSGLLVGLGTKLGNGCTSGHGVCGLPRLAPRSIVFIGFFMVSAFLTANLRHHYPFWTESEPLLSDIFDYKLINQIFLGISAGMLTLNLLYHLISKQTNKISDILVGFGVGIIFGAGLIVSGMTKKSKILNFLVFSKDWDPSLCFVLMTSVLLNFFSFKIILGNKKPVLGEKFEIVANNTINLQLILGGILFGIGWGLSGFCPGPVLTMFPVFTFQVSIIFFFGICGGQTIAFAIESVIAQSKEEAIKQKHKTG